MHLSEDSTSYGTDLLTALQRLTHSVQSPAKTDKFTALSSRFGMK